MLNLNLLNLMMVGNRFNKNKVTLLTPWLIRHDSYIMTFYRNKDFKLYL